MKKRNGQSQPQKFAVRVAAAKAMISDKQRQQTIHFCLTTVYQGAVIALNEEFGFWPDRAVRFRDNLNETLLEFGVLQDDVDTDYAVGALERRYKQIMGESGRPE